MNYFGKIFSNISAAYNEINPATLTGAIDVIVVEQEDGTFLCSPFHVRFGKMGVLRSKEKIVDITVNGVPVPIHMKLGDSGEAYFLDECDDDDLPLDESEDKTLKINFQGSSISSSVSCDDLIVSTQIEAMQPLAPQSQSDNHSDKHSESEHDLEDDNQAKAINDAKLQTPRSSQERSLQKKVRRKKKNKAGNKSETKPIESSRRAVQCDQDDTLLNFGEDALHPYSDSEISVDKKPKKMSKDNLDYKSDSEVEMSKQNENSPMSHDNISWGWGELPNVSKDVAPALSDSPSDSPNGTSVLGNVLSFMNRDKDKDDSEEGIYLDDLNPEELNPEVAAKYFPQFRSSSFSLPASVSNNNNNASSATITNNMKNLSISTSEDEVESGKGASLSNSPNSTESYMKELESFKNMNSFDLVTLSKMYHDMSMSLCGGIENLHSNSSDSEHFLQSIISFDDFSENPLQFIDNPNLVIRMGGRCYTWKMACSILLSLLMFQRPLPEKTMEDLKNQCIPKKMANHTNVKSTWRSWFRSNQTDLSPQTKDQSVEDRMDSNQKLARSGTFSGTTTGVVNYSHEYISDDETNKMFANDVETLNTSNISGAKMSCKKKYKKVLRLKSDVIKGLALRPNSNDVEFSVTTAFQGTTVCHSKIFLWRHDDKIVISDIDGTITRSDVLGHILPIIGKDWAQMGVTNLFTQIENNGYKFLYLSARAIGQAKITRDYLRSIMQDEVALPDGPVLLSPTSLFSALHREVIDKKPEEFKIACLRDIQTLFSQNPFFAGFGNKINDTWAYSAVGIDQSRIFTINHKGEVKLEKLLKFKSSYTDLSQFVDQMFPSLYESSYNHRYSSFMYWRDEFSNVDDQLDGHNKSATLATTSTSSDANKSVVK